MKKLISELRPVEVLNENGDPTTVLQRVTEYVDMTADEIAALEAERAASIDLPRAAAKKRQMVILAGTTIEVAGTPIPTWADPESQAALTALVVASMLNPALTTAWKGMDGSLYPLDATGIAVLAHGVMAFVQSAFACEAAVLAGIAAGTITTEADVHAAAWPT